MGFFDFMKRKPEIRADTETTTSATTPEVRDVLLRALLDKSTMTKEKAREIPTVQACITLISNTISRLPIQLIERTSDGDVKIVKDDPRLTLLNDDTGDTLTAKQFWRAIIEDYYLGKGGYAYINKRGRFYQSLHYVDEVDVSIGYKNFDPIWKEYDLMVQGQRYLPKDFIKILRKTKDGMESKSIVEENPLVLNVAYAELNFELSLAKKGGMKRGFLQAEKTVSKSVIDELKNGFRKLYGESDENVIVLNSGIKFQEASATSTELQLNENKESNAQEICKLFGIPASMIQGSLTGNSMTDNDMNQFIRACVAVMTDIECSLNRDFLLESEKGRYYWAFDTKELTRGSIKERYEAYKIGLEKNFLQIDEVREKEDMEPLGIDWLQLNLNTVFYNPQTKEIYTPNTNASMNLENGAGANAGTVSKADGQDSTKLEERAGGIRNLIITGAPGSGKTTWVHDHMEADAIVVDLDAIKDAISSQWIGFHGQAAELVPVITSIRNAMYKTISEGRIPGRAYVITTETDINVLHRWQKQLNADLKVMETSKTTCIERVKNDQTRLEKEVFLNLIDKWFNNWKGGE